ncbi:uncharacterized protein B0P05DRAFT_556051 [Gilbertella persicaria]|uniref:uncharacterized protein n=1 Tax=Gilbertella persicaria TaxID=101096 RepID=UPI00222072D6|nr:uncharacterized protein B0P05DRAFT_556051 [Gilbertella persicaria]KAI8062789.1 hypothetical protein B0P05DRAFT_556051 [Gilbertella persicaria]
MSPSQDPPPTTALLTGAAGAFGAGLLGAIWHTKRKQTQRMEQELAEGIVHTPHTPVPYTPPKMTPAEYAVARKEASLYAVKTLGYGTLLAFSGAGLIALGVGYWLDVRNFKEFSDKLQIIVPKQTSKLRQMLGGKKLEMTSEEQQELDSIQMKD